MHSDHVEFDCFGERLCFAQASNSGSLDVVDCLIPGSFCVLFLLSFSFACLFVGLH